MTAWAGGSTSAWRRTRAAVLHRDRWTCQLCGTPAHPQCQPQGCDTCAQVHHLDGKANGDNPTRLIATCRRCNRAEGQPVPATAAMTSSRRW